MKRAESTKWTRQEARIFAKLRTPLEIQQHLDSLEYSTDPFYRCPRAVLRDHKAHCFDGALFAAAALRTLGCEPLIIELRAVRDDDHLVALFRRNGCYGAVSKSNFACLRFREPIYRSLRELALSYFEFYYNIHHEKTLREYSSILRLARFDKFKWMTSDDQLERIEYALEESRHHRLFSQGAERNLNRVDALTFKAGMLGTNLRGVYKPKPD